MYASSSSVYGLNKKVPFSESMLLKHQISILSSSNGICKNYHQLYNLNLIVSILLVFLTLYKRNFINMVMALSSRDLHILMI